MNQKDSPDSTDRLLRNNANAHPFISCVSAVVLAVPVTEPTEVLRVHVVVNGERGVLIVCLCQQLSNKHTLACTLTAATKGM